jgi:prenyl protein peptidase
MGYWPIGLLESLKALLVTSILFAAPLLETLVLNGGWKDFQSLQPFRHVWNEWTAWRNLVVVCYTVSANH